MASRNGRHPERVMRQSDPQGNLEAACSGAGQRYELSELLDEYTIECDPDIAEEVQRISEESIAWAGKFFKIVCPHKGDGKIGGSWYEVH